MTEYATFIEQLVCAIKLQEPLPAFPESLELDRAYSLLPEVVTGVTGSDVAGVKAGLTNPDLRALFGLESSLLGQLYGSGRMQQGQAVPYHEKLAIECEIGIVVDAAGQPRSFGPALEFVCVDFARPEDMTPANLVLCNLGAWGFIQGPQKPWSDHILDSPVVLSRDGETVLETSIGDSLGGPVAALQWMREEAGRRGIPASDGALLMAGTCGGAVPAERGHYKADYAELGSVEFTIA